MLVAQWLDLVQPKLDEEVEVLETQTKRKQERVTEGAGKGLELQQK
jgi:hypothetical protein